MIESEIGKMEKKIEKRQPSRKRNTTPEMGKKRWRQGMENHHQSKSVYEVA
jgi:hypothetical protein